MTTSGSALTIDDGDHALDPTTERTIEDLREVITALDRRVPRVERTSELDIARDAAVLRAKALARIAELKKGRNLSGFSFSTDSIRLLRQIMFGR
jgi:hypothetical protein